MFSGEMQLRIATATRHRRAQISKMRDRAIETGNTQLLAAADQAELMLEAFAETQRQLLQSTQSVERTAEVEAGASTVIR